MSRWIERFENFQKALEIFKEVGNDYNSDPTKNAFRLAVIQSYEITFELAWKLLKDYLKEGGIILSLPKEIIKEAFNTNIITDGEIWINMLSDRNSTTHEYNQNKVDEILKNIVTNYTKEFKLLETFFKAKI